LLILEVFAAVIRAVADSAARNYCTNDQRIRGRAPAAARRFSLQKEER
jgi:hypothetical protein